MTLYSDWLRREEPIAFDFRSEFWRQGDSLPEFAAWVELASRRRRAPDVSSLTYRMTRGLLSEVLYAAGGAETELGRLEGALAAVQDWADKGASPTVTPPPLGHWVTTASLRDGFYAFINLLTWARAVAERTDRPYRPGSAMRSGLLPALADGRLHDDVNAALNDFKQASREARLMANYALHAGAIPGGGSPRARLASDGRVYVPLPDMVANGITTWEEFDFSEGRDMLTFARKVMSSVTTFVEAVLSAFEAATPA